ncbi:hypothetical protein QRX50_31285 [Amycolatopsis carbonis]|uniref:Flavin reductase like domain-containing protein n=1 Tax=Amycolatopsis carbonis TaxID=715471 RepID=A0A9Y2IA64_9PSEU|nr:hypothetical protein [Amycolatopsis sp. 2-15]WIX75947.1 hypothetical protein QRX50_31285 [Amycolatopsis sp. 2-15]
MNDHVAIAPCILYFGTPVALLTTDNADGSPNITPMSSAWALGEVVVLGLARSGHGARNLGSRPDLVLNLPGPGQWAAVERLAPLTGADPVPEHKRDRFRYEPRPVCGRNRPSWSGRRASPNARCSWKPARRPSASAPGSSSSKPTCCGCTPRRSWSCPARSTWIPRSGAR